MSVSGPIPHRHLFETAFPQLLSPVGHGEPSTPTWNEFHPYSESPQIAPILEKDHLSRAKENTSCEGTPFLALADSNSGSLWANGKTEVRENPLCSNYPPG